MKKILIVSMVIGMVLMAGAAMATTKTSNVNVTATVAASCTINSVSDVNFGAYDPTSLTDNIAGAGSMTFRCVKGTSYKYYAAGTRSMTGGGDSLLFTLWEDVGRSTTTFPIDNSGGSTVAASNTPVTKNVYGKIAALQDVSVNNYSVVIVATVEY